MATNRPQTRQASKQTDSDDEPYYPTKAEMLNFKQTLNTLNSNVQTNNGKGVPISGKSSAVGRPPKKPAQVAGGKMEPPLGGNNAAQVNLFTYSASLGNVNRKRVTKQQDKIDITGSKQEHSRQLEQVEEALKVQTRSYLMDFEQLSPSLQEFYIDQLTRNISLDKKAYGEALMSHLTHILPVVEQNFHARSLQLLEETFLKQSSESIILLAVELGFKVPSFAKEHLVAKILLQAFEASPNELFDYLPQRYFKERGYVLCIREMTTLIVNSMRQSLPGFNSGGSSPKPVPPSLFTFLLVTGNTENIYSVVSQSGEKLAVLMESLEGVGFQPATLDFLKLGLPQLINAKKKFNDNAAADVINVQIKTTTAPVLQSTHLPNFLFKNVVNFLKESHDYWQLYYAKIINKVIMKQEPSVQDLQSFKLLIQKDSMFIDFLTEDHLPATLPLSLQQVMELIESLSSSDLETIKTFFHSNNPNQWLATAQKQKSGTVDKDLMRLSWGDIQTLISKWLPHLGQTTTAKTEDDIQQMVLQLCKLGAPLFRKYFADMYQATLACFTAFNEAPYALVSLPTGSGKSWLILILAVYYHQLLNQRVLILVTNADLLKQLSNQKGEVPGITIILATSYDETIHTEKVVLIDEVHEVMDQHGYTFKKVFAQPAALYNGAMAFQGASLYNAMGNLPNKPAQPQLKQMVSKGLWSLRGKKVIGFTATVSRPVIMTFASLFPNPVVHHFQSEYEVTSGGNPHTLIDFHNCRGEVEPFEAMKEDLLEDYLKAPQICQVEEQHIEPLKAFCELNQMKVYTLSQVGIIYNKEEGVLIMPPHISSAIDSRFGVTAHSKITIPVKTKSEGHQRTGRSNRKRGQQVGKIYLKNSTQMEIEDEWERNECEKFSNVSSLLLAFSYIEKLDLSLQTKINVSLDHFIGKVEPDKPFLYVEFVQWLCQTDNALWKIYSDKVNTHVMNDLNDTMATEQVRDSEGSMTVIPKRYKEIFYQST